MFDSLQDGLASAFKSLRGKGKLTESNIREGLGLVEQTLLDADVSFSVVQEFMKKVTEKALGQRVLLALNPSEQLMGVVHEEMLELLGKGEDSFDLKKGFNVLMLCGLQGSGKTTTCGKLGKYLQDKKLKPMLVAADLQRPAAIEQLHVIGKQLGIPVYSEGDHKDPVKVCQNAIAKAKQEEIDVVILDTAGRLAIDEELMQQLKEVDRKVMPDQVMLVVDGMTGQDAVNSAGAFNKALELNGVIMTKLDGDSRGGALLSVRHVTGVPIKFLGTGEHLNSLEYFRPEGMAGRILGQGDIATLLDVAQREINADKQQKLEEDLKKGTFTLDHFKDQLQQISKPGLMQKMLGLMGGPMKEMQKMMGGADTGKEMKKLVGIIDSMTPAERKDPKVIDPSRRQRIAKGAGVQAKDVNGLVKQFDSMASMMTAMASGGVKDRMRLFQEMQGNAMNPNASMRGPKKGTGKRLTPKERAKLKKERERAKRKAKRKK
ncbi:MAG: signal recognition particle protein [Pirellulaceae bacterium]|nr:signal recognition particle protein [Pirellulaceae bacterium]